MTHAAIMSDCWLKSKEPMVDLPTDLQFSHLDAMTNLGGGTCLLLDSFIQKGSEKKLNAATSFFGSEYKLPFLVNRRVAM